MSYASTILADSPLAYWRLGEASGTTAADASGNGHTGTYGGSLTLDESGLIAGDPDTAVSFSGGNINVGTASDLELTGDMSVEVWTQMASSSVLAIFGGYELSGFKGWGLGCSINASGKPDFWDGAAWHGCPSAINDAATHHVVATISGTGSNNATWYLDGSSVGTFTAATRSYSGVSGFTKRIASDSGGGNPYSSILDEIAVYNFALSYGRVVIHYAVGTGGGGSPARGLYRPANLSNGAGGSFFTNPLQKLGEILCPTPMRRLLRGKTRAMPSIA